MSKVYRFEQPADFSLPFSIELLQKRKKFIRKDFYFLASDGEKITDGASTRSIQNYKKKSNHLSVTLTKMESDLIALSNPGMQPPIALEEMHPWLPKQVYINDSVINFRNLSIILSKFGRHLFFASEYCNEKWKTICNSIRKKSILDTKFYSAWHLPIQDTYILEEKRPERSVVSIDFNGMYLACMQNLFPKPSKLRSIILERYLIESEKLIVGLYRCILDGPISNFITHHNPFRNFHSGRHLQAKIDEPVEVDLNEFEINFYKRHFRSIYLVDAVVSDDTVPHPLAKEVIRSYEKRRNYRNQGNKALADREKYLATLMTSCAHRTGRKSWIFEDIFQAAKTLTSEYGINAENIHEKTFFDIWHKGHKGIKINSKNGLTLIEGPNVFDGSSCFLFGQRIVAHGRIRLLEMMENIIKKEPSAEICYVNIDSIHFSFPNQNFDKIIDWLRSESSDALGSFKIECITSHGLWLEPGRYWLYADNVEKFKNRSVGNKKQPFNDYLTHVSCRKLGELYIPIETKIRMERTISVSRSISRDLDNELIRQKLIEVGNFTTVEEVWNQLEKNKNYATPIKFGAFLNLRDRIISSCFAASKQEEEAQVM